MAKKSGKPVRVIVGEIISEDEYDLQIAQEALDDWTQDGYQTRPIEELWEECDL
ncbi:DUF6290 family protein [Arcanobacterium canis]|uniref:DUF6290 family protein n=1 Tax=Arcanobacterium canis TaxID=999183 RepID=A0ABY8FYF5_9ACTO|nr:DUF6290 family protein [Arcanobacterium canis]WFM83558.1 DUF6290 family protein [Arcanobacterium canis]